MKQDLKYILKPKLQDGVTIIGDEDEIDVIIEEIPAQEEIDYINKNGIKNLTLIDPKDFSLLDMLPSICNLRILFSYSGRREKYIKIDFSPLYKRNLQSLYFTVNPKIVFSEQYDCFKQTGLKKLQACFAHIHNLDWIETLESLCINFNDNQADLNFLKNKKELKYLILQNGTFLTLKGLSNCESLNSLTLKRCEITNSGEIGALLQLKNLSIKSMVFDDLSKSLCNLTELEYLYLGYNGVLTDVFWLENMHHLNVFINYCKILNGNLECFDHIPYAKLAVEYPHYNRKNSDLSKTVAGLSASGIPTYLSF